MLSKFLALIRKRWHDPVWSKVIAHIIVGFGSVVVGGLIYWAWQHEESKAPETLFTEDELIYRNLTVGTCEKPQDVAKLYVIARELQTKAQQDAEFAGIVVEAVCANDERLALEIFTSISDPSLRNVASKRVIDKYIRDKKYEDASRWVKHLSNAQDRDWWTRRILESKRRDG